jgi:hypothetical protein
MIPPKTKQRKNWLVRSFIYLWNVPNQFTLPFPDRSNVFNECVVKALKLLWRAGLITLTGCIILVVLTLSSFLLCTANVVIASFVSQAGIDGMPGIFEALAIVFSVLPTVILKFFGLFPTF